MRISVQEARSLPFLQFRRLSDNKTENEEKRPSLSAISKSRALPRAAAAPSPSLPLPECAAAAQEHRRCRHGAWHPASAWLAPPPTSCRSTVCLGSVGASSSHVVDGRASSTRERKGGRGTGTGPQRARDEGGRDMHRPAARERGRGEGGKGQGQARSAARLLPANCSNFATCGKHTCSVLCWRDDQGTHAGDGAAIDDSVVQLRLCWSGLAAHGVGTAHRRPVQAKRRRAHRVAELEERHERARHRLRTRRARGGAAGATKGPGCLSFDLLVARSLGAAFSQGPGRQAATQGLGSRHTSARLRCASPPTVMHARSSAVCACARRLCSTPGSTPLGAPPASAPPVASSSSSLAQSAWCAPSPSQSSARSSS